MVTLLEYWDGCEECAAEGYRCLAHRYEANETFACPACGEQVDGSEQMARAARYWRVLARWLSAHVEDTTPDTAGKTIFHRSRVHPADEPCRECLAAQETRP